MTGNGSNITSFTITILNFSENASWKVESLQEISLKASKLSILQPFKWCPYDVNYYELHIFMLKKYELIYYELKP